MSSCSVFFLWIRHLPRSTLFPYTTLFRSRAVSLFLQLVPSEVGAQLALPPPFEFEVPGRELLGPSPHHLFGEPVSGEVEGERSEEHTSELQSRLHLVCRLLLEKKKKQLTN